MPLSSALRDTPCIRRDRVAGMWTTIVERDGWREVYLLALAAAGESPAGLAERVAARLADLGASPVRCVVCGGAGAPALELEPRVDVIDTLAEPASIRCVRVLAVAGPEVALHRAGERAFAASFEVACERHLHLVGLRSPDVSGPPRRQAEECFTALEAALAAAGAKLQHVARTWLHVARIHEWYDDLNVARNAAYQRHGLFSRRLPASTAVGLAEAGGAALALSAWVISGDCVRGLAVGSPSLPEPRVSGGAYSRAVELRGRDVRRLLVSGTASLDPDGRPCGATPEAQVARTVAVAGELLASRGYGWRDVVHAVGFVPRPGDAPAIGASLAAALPELPEVPLVGAELSRRELLFELEVEAVAAVEGR